VEPFEQQLRRDGIELAAGLDEVGRGALFGPVVAGAVILSHDDEIQGLADSKVLTAVQRLRLFGQIDRRAVAWSIGLASAREIDRINILQATHLAMRRALAALPTRPQHLLVDALRIEGVDLEQTSIVKGDARCRSIAAASIVAKCARDFIVAACARRVPGYGLERNKGYGTREHLDAVLRNGHSPMHRRSFRVQGSLPFDSSE
jgi:ribonuclease HII